MKLMANQNKLLGRTKRRVNALERVKKFLSDKKHLPKRFHNEDGTLKVSGKEFNKARAKYELELKGQISVLEKRTKDVNYEATGSTV